MSGYNIVQMIAPELILVTGACVVLLMGVWRTARMHFTTGWLAFITILAALFVSWNASTDSHTMLGMRIGDLAWYIRLIVLSVGAVVLLVNWELPDPQERGDSFSMILFSLSGILFTAAADDLILLFLALELVSVPTYILVATSSGQIRAQEAAVKYFFLGATASALMVYGFSFMYGASGTTSISTMVLHAEGGYATLGFVLVFAGLAYKIAAVPFHVYAADVYQGAASPITGLLGFFPKVAGFVALVKLLWILQPADYLRAGWELPELAFIFLWIIAVASMTVGNVLALMQTNVKRMLAYSSIAHSGYMLIGVLVGPVTGGAALRDGVSAMLFYIVIYGLMNLGAFAVLAIVRADGRPVETLDDLAGLARRRPGAALAMAVCVFSLMGMPPTAGFLGKVYVISSALSAGASEHYMWLIALAVIAVINSAIGAAYYLRIIGACYIREPVHEHMLQPNSFGLQVGLVLCCSAVVLFGLWPQGLMTMARRPFHDPRGPAWVHKTSSDSSEPPACSDEPVAWVLKENR